MQKLILLIALLLSTPLAAEEKKERVLTVAAASSLEAPLDEISKELRSELPIDTLNISYGASGALQQQIAQSAPIDIFLSAAEKPIQDLAAKNLLKPGSATVLLSNELVLIAPAISTLQGFADLKGSGVMRIAVGESRTVPAGMYAMELLTKLGLLKNLEAKLVYAKDVKQVLTYVERGEVSAGLVYKSDTVGRPLVRIVSVAPADSHKPIRYAMAVVRSSRMSEAAAAFMRILESPKAGKIWSKYGFGMLAKEPHEHR